MLGRGVLAGDLVRLRTEHTKVGSVEVLGPVGVLVRWYMTGYTEIVAADRLEVVGRFSGAQ